MQSNYNPLIPWITFFFLMRKIWRFSAPGKRNQGLVVPRAEHGSARLVPEWLLGILDSGHLSSSSKQHLYEKAKIGNKEGSKVQRKKSVFGVCECVRLCVCVCVCVYCTYSHMSITRLWWACAVPVYFQPSSSSPTNWPQYPMVPTCSTVT